MFDINLIFYGLSRMFQFPQFVLALRSSVWDVFINFLLIDATDRSKISSDKRRFFIALSLYPLSFFANTPFKRIEFLYICNPMSSTLDISNYSVGSNDLSLKYQWFTHQVVEIYRFENLRLWQRLNTFYVILWYFTFAELFRKKKLFLICDQIN